LESRCLLEPSPTIIHGEMCALYYSNSSIVYHYRTLTQRMLMPVDPPGVCYLVTTVSHVMLNANKLINTHKLKTVGGIGLICSNDFLYLS